MNLQTKIYRVIWFLLFFGSIAYIFLFDTTATFQDFVIWLIFLIGLGSLAGGILGILTKQITLKGFTYQGQQAIRFSIFYGIFGIAVCLISIIVWIN